ncbi:MAG: hypothetical protein WB626_07745 [Bacteroidota bacterium]
MSIILALTTVLALVLVGAIRQRKAKPAEQPVLVRRYVHPGHTWTRQTEDGDVLVGVDDFTQTVIGSVEGVELPRLLGKVRQGEGAFTLRRGKRSLRLVSPVTGRVIQKNEMLSGNPSMVNDSPYGDGWLVRVRPARLGLELRNLLTGAAAREYLDASKAQLARIFSGTPALMYQDGGVMIRGLADRCTDAEWEAVEEELFLSGPGGQGHTRF